MAFLAVGELHVQLFETRLGSHRSLLKVRQLGLHFGQIGTDLLAPCPGLLRQLVQAQALDLQFVAPALGFAGLPPGRHQPLRGIGISRLGTDQGGARFLVDERLCPQLFLEVLDFLGAREQARLLRILRIETHAMRADRMPAGNVDRLARPQLAPAVQRFVQRGGRLAPWSQSSSTARRPASGTRSRSASRGAADVVPGAPAADGAL